MSSSEIQSNGLVELRSRSSFEDTLQKLREGIARRGLKLFTTINHSEAAAEAGLAMQPTQVWLFGSPKAGTPLMVASPSLAIDLPLKVLVAENTEGVVTLTYSAPEFLIARHGLSHEAAGVLGGVAKLVAEAAS